MGYYRKLIGGYKFYLTDDRKRAVPGRDIPGTALCVVKKYNAMRIISEYRTASRGPPTFLRKFFYFHQICVLTIPVRIGRRMGRSQDVDGSAPVHAVLV